jgi:hypothetical protein
VVVVEGGGRLILNHALCTMHNDNGNTAQQVEDRHGIPPSIAPDQ